MRLVVDSIRSYQNDDTAVTDDPMSHQLDVRAAEMLDTQHQRLLRHGNTELGTHLRIFSQINSRRSEYHGLWT
jgi:hypothetical protein